MSPIITPRGKHGTDIKSQETTLLTTLLTMFALFYSSIEKMKKVKKTAVDDCLTNEAN